jgi:hypothetical protein
MGLFESLGFRTYKTLTDAVRSGNLRAVRKMLAAGADPNVCPPNDDTVPIFYALHKGPKMVRLLIEHGADVNISGRGDATPLAKAESRGQHEVAAVLRAAGARIRVANDEYEMDPRFRLKLLERIPFLVLQTRIQYRTEKPEAIADRVESQLNYQFPPNMPPDLRSRVRQEIRTLILRECGVKEKPQVQTRPVPSSKEEVEERVQNLFGGEPKCTCCGRTFQDRPSMDTLNMPLPASWGLPSVVRCMACGSFICEDCKDSNMIMRCTNCFESRFEAIAKWVRR